MVDGQIWVQVSTDKGQGWILKELLGSAGAEVVRQVRVTGNVERANIRRTPGIENKSASDVITTVKSGTVLDVIGDQQIVNGVTWWHVRTGSLEGWIAEKSQKYGQLIEHVTK